VAGGLKVANATMVFLNTSRTWICAPKAGGKSVSPAHLPCCTSSTCNWAWCSGIEAEDERIGASVGNFSVATIGT
jgi:hypothetical protein